MTPAHIYDQIGTGYRAARREDPRLARLILDALADSQSIVNVGAGTGSYEPKGRFVLAVEPSNEMVRQRPPLAAPVVRGVAEALPLRDRTASASLAILTVHHWSDQDAGLSELCRVARDRVVILTWDPEAKSFWLMQDYFPEFLEVDRRRCPSIASVASRLTDAEVIPVPIPHDCQDGFLGAYWRRPAAYLDAGIRSGISSFAQCADLSPLRRLERDLESGEWEARYASILRAEELDLGYRIVAGCPRKE
jgi:SAM-dependent methyltransferase